MSSTLEDSGTGGFHALTASELSGPTPPADAQADAAAAAPRDLPVASAPDRSSASASPSSSGVVAPPPSLWCADSSEPDGDGESERASESDGGSERADAAAGASASPASETTNLRSAFLQAQSRARRQEEAMAFIYLHVDAKVKAAVREVSRKKRRVRALRVLAANAAQTASNAMGGVGGGGGNAVAMGAPWSARSASDSAPSFFVAAPLSAHSAHSPHRDAYISALGSPVLASSPTSGLIDPRTAGGSGALRRQVRQTVVPSPSMPSLVLASSSSSATVAAAAAEDRAPKDDVDGSFCLLAFESGDGRPGLERSSSHQAMMEAHEALEELHRDSTSSTPEAPPSLQVSPQPDEAKEAGSAAYPSYHHHHPSTLPALHPSSSPSHGARHGHILATSPYHIAPSTSLPPLRKTSLAGVGRGSSTGSTTSPHLGPVHPTQSGSPAPAQTQQVGQGSMLPPSSFGLGGAATGNSGPSASVSSFAPSTASAGSTAHIYADLAMAVQSLRESQKSFSTLANFCAPLILRSPSFLRLQEEDTLQHLGVLPRPQRDVALSSDEEMSRSAELQLDDIATHMGGSGALASRTLEASDVSASGTESSASRIVGVSVGGAVSSGAADHALSEPESEEHKSPFGASASASAPAPQSDAELEESDHPSLVIVPPMSPPPLSARSKEQEREAMKIYIKKLRAEVAEEESILAAGGSGATEHAPVEAPSCSSSSSLTAGASASKADSDAAVTLEEALESCVLLHRHLTSERARLASLERSVDAKVARGIAHCRQRIDQLCTDNALLRVQLHELESLRSDHSAAQLKLRNMEEILRALKIETNDKGELKEGCQLPGDKKGSSRWTLASLLVLGSLVVASAFNWHRMWEAVQCRLPHLLGGLGLNGATATDAAARMAAAGAAGAATVAATATAATHFATAATVDAASQTASHIAAEAATQTASQAHTAAATVASRFAAASSHGPVRHSFIQRFPALVDWLTIISLPLVQTA